MIKYIIDKGWIDRGAHISHEIVDGEEFDRLEKAIEVVKYKVSVDTDKNFYYEIIRFEDGEYDDNELIVHSLEAIRMLEPYNVFGTLLKEARLLKGMTQTELAEKLETIPQSIQKYEYGSRIPDGKMMIKLINELELNPEVVSAALE